MLSIWSQIKSPGRFGITPELQLQVLEASMPMEEKLCMETQESKASASSFGSLSIKKKVLDLGLLETAGSKGIMQLLVLKAVAFRCDLKHEIAIFGLFSKVSSYL